MDKLARVGITQPIGPIGERYVKTIELLRGANDVTCDLLRMGQHHDMAPGNLDRRGIGGLDLIPLQLRSDDQVLRGTTVNVGLSRHAARLTGAVNVRV